MEKKSKEKNKKLVCFKKHTLLYDSRIYNRNFLSQKHFPYYWIALVYHRIQNVSLIYRMAEMYISPSSVKTPKYIKWPISIE